MSTARQLRDKARPCPCRASCSSLAPDPTPHMPRPWSWKNNCPRHVCLFLSRKAGSEPHRSSKNTTARRHISGTLCHHSQLIVSNVHLPSASDPCHSSLKLFESAGRRRRQLLHRAGPSRPATPASPTQKSCSQGLALALVGAQSSRRRIVVESCAPCQETQTERCADLIIH